MCGILGVYCEDETKFVDEAAIRDMCATLQHRGPDDRGYFFNKNFGLGVCRLSVIDLFKGHQPIHNEDRMLWVVFNGEIYNYLELRGELIKNGHIFYTETDTEVIVHLYEEKKVQCLNDLNGMFTLAVLDTRSNSLFIARDRLGIKPLYYYHKDGLFIFASELKAILGFPGFSNKVNYESLYNFLSLNYVPAPNTIFKDIKQLLAGHYISITNNNFTVVQYWDICFSDTVYTDENFITERLRYLLKKSIKRMLRSDVPLGAFLSGGMDSSSLVSLMGEASGRALKTFSVGFEENSYDETYFANFAAKHFGTEHRRVICGPKDIIQNLPKIVWHADNLLADPAMLPLYLVSKLAKEHVTVCISGDGGDELFIGYPTYLADIYLYYYKKIPRFIRRLIISQIVNFLPVSSRKLSFEYKAKKFVEGAELTLEKAHYWWRTVFNDGEKESLFSDDILKEIGVADSYSSYSRQYDNCQYQGGELFNKLLYADMKKWLTDNNLIRVDAMSMAHSLEVRVPFLDHELVEFMAKVPVRLKMKNSSLKHLLKKTMRDKVPPKIITRKKAGWNIPLAKWIQSDLKDYITETIMSSKAINSGIFKKDKINNLLYEHSHKRRDNSFKIWGLLVFSHWYENFC